MKVNKNCETFCYCDRSHISLPVRHSVEKYQIFSPLPANSQIKHILTYGICLAVVDNEGILRIIASDVQINAKGGKSENKGEYEVLMELELTLPSSSVKLEDDVFE